MSTPNTSTLHDRVNQAATVRRRGVVVAVKVKKGLRCPIHDVQMFQHDWRGKRFYKCEEAGCDVKAWKHDYSGFWLISDGETRKARMEAHRAFDALWKSGEWVMAGKKRHHAYRELANFMGIEARECHIGFFSADQCGQVLDFCSFAMRDEINKKP